MNITTVAPKSRVFIVAIEASADEHAASLVNELTSAGADIDFSGVGGHAMRAAGVNTIADLTPYAVIGATDFIQHWRKFADTLKLIIRYCHEHKPDLIVLIDAPSFNLRLAPQLKLDHHKILYYISPQIWAWKAKRIHLIKQCVDAMAVILPFEKNIYEPVKLPTYFVGNPLTKKVSVSQPVPILQKEFKLNPDANIIGIIPGSRTREISRILPTLYLAANLILEKYPETQFILPRAKTISPAMLAKYQDLAPANLHIIEDRTYDAIACCHAAMVCSGTASLETALLGIPMVIVYKTSWLTCILGKLLLKTPYIGLPNILAQRKIVQELIQHRARPKTISNEIIAILDDESYRNQMKENINQLGCSLSRESVELSLAELTQKMLIHA